MFDRSVLEGLSGPLHGLGCMLKIHCHGRSYDVMLRRAHSREGLDPPARSPVNLRDEGGSVADYECRRGPLDDDMAVVQDGEPVDYPLGLPHVVGYQEDRRPNLDQKTGLVP